MREFIKALLKYWRGEINDDQNFLKLKDLEIQNLKDTSLILGCFAILTRGRPERILTWKGEELLRETKPKQIERKLREIKNEANKTNKKVSDYIDDLIKKESNFKRFGIRVFKFSSRFIDHIKYGHIRIRVVDGSLPKRLADGSPNPNFIKKEYDYLPGNGRTRDSFASPLQPKVQAAGGLHILKNVNNNSVRIVENLGTFKLPSGEIIRKVKLEFWIEETQQWIPKKGGSTMWPKSWSIEKIQKAILEASENIIENDLAKRKFRGKTEENIEIEFFIDEFSKEIETAYIVF